MRISIQSLLLLLPLALATHIRITIPSTPSLPNPSSLPPTTHATLTTLGAVISASLRLDNTFDFRNLSSGSYLLDVHCPTNLFAPLRIDVQSPTSSPSHTSEDVLAFQTFRGNEWANKGESISVTGKEGGVWTFDVKAGSGKEYFFERSGFSPLSVLKSPMILIAIATMGVVFGMPYLMDNMDPELRAEFEERQKSSPLSGGAAQNPLQSFDAAAWLAGTGGAKKGEDSNTPPQGRITR